MPAIFLIAPIVAGVALFGITWWLERATRRPGLSFFLIGLLLLFSGGILFSQGRVWRPLLFGVQAFAFIYLAHWRRKSAREVTSQ